MVPGAINTQSLKVAEQAVRRWRKIIYIEFLMRFD